MLIINITAITSVAVTLLYTSLCPCPSWLWHHWCDKWFGYAGAWRWVCVYQLCKSTKQCNKGRRQGILERAPEDSACLKRVLLFPMWASEANFMKFLRDTKNEQCFSQIFSKQEFLLCQCCAYEGNLFLWARFWMLFCIFWPVGLDIWGRSELWIIQ